MLQSNSKKINKGDTFIALRGINDDGHNYVEDAIKRGASKVIVEKGEYSVETEKVEDTLNYLNRYINDNNIDIKIIGVTGTNGKTTTCYLIYQLLNKLNIKCSYIGTLGYIVDDKIEQLDNTTPSKIDTYNLLKKSEYLNCKYVVMEISSQALDQDRIDFIRLDYIIYTNLTRDHLDYHKSFGKYIKAKQKIFNLLKDTGISLINNDDEYSELFKVGKYKTYGIKNDSDYKLDNYKNNLIGEFNKYNLLASISLLYEMGYTYNDLYNIVVDLKEPNGRMNVVEYKNNKIIIDYAHTPDAVENVLNTVNSINHNRIITIIGCGGNRDKGKRPIMGSISTKLSDYVIFTSDNPRYEDELEIIKDITFNIDSTNYEVEIDRKAAIMKGIKKLNSNDILMILGKGHEDYQIIKDKKIHFDDKEIVNNILSLHNIK